VEEPRVWLQGINRQQRCRIAASLGTVKFCLIDRDGGMTEELAVIAHLVKRAEVPIIFGMADFLERYLLCFDYCSGTAFLEEGSAFPKQPTGKEVAAWMRQDPRLQTS